MEMLDLTLPLEKDLNVLPYGEPGCGKTRFVASVGEVLYTLAIDVDKGFKTMKLVPKPWLNNIVAIQMTTFKDLDKIYKLAQKNDPDEWTKEFSTPDKPIKITKPFEAICFDTWSEVNWKVKEERRRIAGKISTGLSFRGSLEIQHWGDIYDLNILSIEAFRDLPITFICTMHEQVIQDDKLGVVRGVPSLNGKAASEVGKHFDVVGHMTIDLAGKYVMDFKTIKRFQAKTRLASKDGKLIDPTFQKLIADIGA